jgi:indole-3-glycerol phosphate synthase
MPSNDYRLPSELAATILGGIVASKLRVLAEARQKLPAQALRMASDRWPVVRSLKRALRKELPGVIAEIKPASPSAGVLRSDVDPIALAEEYRAGGAAALSVVTESEYFRGRIESVSCLRWKTRLPILRKDFIVDSYQLLETRHAGGDAVLLIAALLEGGRLRDLREEAEELGMDALVEVHDDRELDRALEAGASLIGVNNRNLKTLDVSLDVALSLAPRLPPGVVAVAESGIGDREALRRLWASGYRRFLIGEALMRSASPGRALGGMLEGLRETGSKAP